jgi:hypothetical protein
LPKSFAIICLLIAVFLVASGAFIELLNRKMIRLFDRPVSKVRWAVNAFEHRGVVARQKADDVISSMRRVDDAEMALLMSRKQLEDGKGALLWSGAPIHGRVFKLWQLWLEIPGFYDGPLAGMQAHFADNTSTQAIVTGSTTIGRNWGRGTSTNQTNAWTQTPSGVSNISISGTSVGHSFNHIRQQASGHATVKIVGPKFNHVVLFSDALEAAQVANLINSWANNTYDERLAEIEIRMLEVHTAKDEVLEKIPGFLAELSDIPADYRAAISGDFKRLGLMTTVNED